MNDKLKKLQDLMKMANEGLTRDEFIQSFKTIVSHIASLKKGQN